MLLKSEDMARLLDTPNRRADDYTSFLVDVDAAAPIPQEEQLSPVYPTEAFGPC